jgi:hypothetical protein
VSAAAAVEPAPSPLGRDPTSRGPEGVAAGPPPPIAAPPGELAGARVAETPGSAPVAPLSPSAVAAERARLLATGRKATIEGRRKEALQAFRAVYKLDPKDPALRVYVAMALGHTGQGHLVLDGRGPITIDGHVFHAPAKLIVAAGPHRVERVDGAVEVQVARGAVQHVSSGSAVGAAVAAHHATGHAARGKVKHVGVKKNGHHPAASKKRTW